MRVIVAECVRYFEKPLCFQMPPGHVHTSRCWDQEFHELRELLFNSESDARALEQANKLLKQENFHLKEQIKPSSTTGGGMRGPRPSWISMDEASIWDKIKDIGDVDKDIIAKMLAAYPSNSTAVESDTDIHLRRIYRPDGTEGYQTSDGKIFTHKSQAARHAVLLRKRP